MKILIDIGHPAHVHLFKNLASHLISEGHKIFFTVRQGECETELLSHYNFDHKLLGPRRKSKAGKISGLLFFTMKILAVAFRFRPDIYLSHGSMYAGLAAFLTGKPHIALEDSGNMEQIRFSKPFSTVILSPDILPVDLGKKHLRYRGYHEIAYLHPEYFLPDKSIYADLGIEENEKYCIMRFVAWRASHDIRQQGLSDKEKEYIIGKIAGKMRVFITSEAMLPENLEKYRVNISPEKIHDALYFASLVVSEGATIASEAGVLGTTTVYINTIRRSYCEDQERYGLVYNYTESKPAISKIEELIRESQSLSKKITERENLLKNKIDVTSFLIWFIKEWPESRTLMAGNPDIQNSFA